MRLNSIEKFLPGVKAELNAKLSHFQSLWDAQGVPLLKKIVEEIGLPFHSNLDVSLMVSETEASRGLPNNKLQINLISFLEASSAAIGMRAPLGEDFFVGLMLHEVLHKYVDNNRVQERSAVLRSVPVAWLWGLTNPALVYAHLHSFALEQLGYEKLGLHAELQKVRAQDESFNPEYVRAWDIVTRGLFGPFLIEEMRALARGLSR